MTMTYYKYAVPASFADPNCVAIADITPADETKHRIVDVLWEEGQEPAEWVQYRVKPETVEHWFPGQEDLWHAFNPTE
jgi:pyridoxine/pyridoxamine 5'-phosphate oxidase